MSQISQTGPGGGPLAGLKVLELGHIVAGPTAGQVFGDLGADVIKIESVGGGDLARTMPGPMSAMFSFLNRNKRSIALDLKREGKGVFLDLARTADVVVENFSYGAIDRLGIGYGVVSAFNPGVVWLSLKGFLPGPNEAQPMLDELAQMAGGLAFMTGTAEKPARAGASVIDIGAATHGCVAVLAALRERDRMPAAERRGQYITAGLYETSVYLVAQWMAAAQSAGEASIPLSQIRQGTRMGFAIYRLFEAADGERIFVGITSDAHWIRFCEAFGREDLGKDERYQRNAGRLANRLELAGELERMFATMPASTIAAKLMAARIPCSPLRRPDQLADETHLVESGQLLPVSFPNGKVGKLPKLPFRSDGYEMPLRYAPPGLGEHTLPILQGLGYSSGRIQSLVDGGHALAGGDKETAR